MTALAVFFSRGSGGGRLELDVTIGQRGAARAGGNCVVKNELVQQQGAAAELVDDHLIDLVGHADLGFCESNRHLLNHPFLFVVFCM